MRRLVLIANPNASGFTASLHREVVAALDGPFQVTPVWPNGPEQARQWAADAAADGVDVVVAMGGDGVMHQVANGIAGTAAALGIVPAGTTNVLGRILGIPGDAVAAAGVIAASEETTTLPTGHLQAETVSGATSSTVTFAAGIGFDAEVVRVAERRPLDKVHFGSLHYAKAAFGRLREFRKRPANLRVEWGSRRVDAVAVLVQLHGEYSFFGRIPIRLGPPEGMTVVTAETLGAVRALRLAGRALTRRDVGRLKGIHLWSGVDKLVVEADPEAWFQADGELLGQGSAFELTADAPPLRVVVPPSG